MKKIRNVFGLFDRNEAFRGRTPFYIIKGGKQKGAKTAECGENEMLHFRRTASHENHVFQNMGLVFYKHEICRRPTDQREVMLTLLLLLLRIRGLHTFCGGFCRHSIRMAHAPRPRCMFATAATHARHGPDTCSPRP